VIVGAILGLALCGVFVEPNVWLSSRTIASRYSSFFIGEAHGFDRFSVILGLRPSQTEGEAGTHIHTQTLVLPLIWCVGVAAVAVARRQLEPRAAVASSLLGLSLVGAMLPIVDPSWWASLPQVLTVIQFPFGLLTFLRLFAVTMIAVLLADARVRQSRAAIASLLAMSEWQIGLASYLALSAQPSGATAAPTPATIRASAVPQSFAFVQKLQFRLSTRHPIEMPDSRRASRQSGTTVRPSFFSQVPNRRAAWLRPMSSPLR
jgi:hypothetical protein